MTRAPFRMLVPVTIAVIACCYVLSRADDPRAEKLREQQGLAGAAISIRVKNSDMVYHVEHALVKSLGGQSFLTGNLLLVRDANGQQPPVKECRAWIPLQEIQAVLEYKENPFSVKHPSKPPADAPEDGPVGRR
jgi:hypothetical protein